MDLTNTMFGMCCMKHYWPGNRHRKERVLMWESENVAEEGFPANWSHILQEQIPEVPDPTL
jgi:hypothetical protein